MSYLKQLSLKWKFFWKGLIYLAYIPQAIRYSKFRDRADQDLTPLEIPDPNLGEKPGKLLQAEASTTGANFYFEQAELEINFLTSDLVRLTWKPTVLPYPYAIDRHDWTDVNITLNQVEDDWILTPEPATLKLWVGEDGSLKFYDQNGQLFRQEQPPQKIGEALTHRAELRPEEHIYGLGERSFSQNLRTAKAVTEKGEPTEEPHQFRMWNFDAAGQYSPGSDPMYLCIPIYMGLHQQGSYLIFYENSYEALFQFSNVATATFSGGALRYYVTVGTPDQLVERYTELTGRSPLPPRWALGYHHSRWGFGKETKVRETYRLFEKHNLPVSAFHLDIDVMVDYQAFTIDPKRFPDLKRFINELSVHHVKFISIINPGIKYTRNNQMFLEGQILDAFCKLPNGQLVVAPVWPGLTVFPDYTHPMVRRWWTRQYAYLLEVGVGGFWHDMNEPAAFIAWGDRSLPKTTQHFMEGRGATHREAHNIYGMLQAVAGFESLRKYRPHERPFIVSRAGWAGLQRYAWVWTGDVESSWEALRRTISTVVGLGLSGIPFTGSDTGGFQGNPSAELYTRWFQMSTFMMFYRTHSSNNVEHRAPWIYGEPTLSILREFMNLRYRLIPYIYTLTWETTQKGYPPVRPVFWIDPKDSKLWDIDDAFLLGNSLMICPICEEGQRSRSVFLPQGEWYHFWDDQRLQGSNSIELEAPLERLPVLVKAGSILPMEEKGKLMLHLYPTTEGRAEGCLYSDAGDGYESYRIDEWKLTPEGEGLSLTWQQQGDYPFSYSSIQLYVHGVELQEVSSEEQELKIEFPAIECDRPFNQMRFRVNS